VQIHLIYGPSREVQVGILKPGNDQVALQVEDRRIGPGHCPDFFVAAHSDDSVAADCQSAGQRLRIICRPDLPVYEDAIRVLFLRLCVSAA